MSTIQSVMHENRVFEPSRAWVAQANVKKADCEALNAKAERDFQGFWADLARETLAWHKPFTRTLDDRQLLVLANLSSEAADYDVAEVPGWDDAELVIGNIADAVAAVDGRLAPWQAQVFARAI